MQTDEAAHLRAVWGNKPCDHPSFDREYYLGAHTGDYVCEQCGRDFSPAEAHEIELDRHKREKD